MTDEVDIHVVPAFIVDTPAGIEMFRLLALKHALALEIKTGMVHSRVSMLRQANAVLMRNGWIETPFRRKGAALEALDNYIEDRQWAMFDDDLEIAGRLGTLFAQRRGNGQDVDWDTLSCLERHGAVWAWGVLTQGERVPESACGDWYEGRE